MRNVFGRLSRRSAALAVVALAAIGVGVAVASIPGTDATITGCYNNVNGQLRVIDAPKQTCVKPGESPISWNQRGVQGPQGHPGRQGRQPRAAAMS
jgi:hypothetical protein